jgi:hypothetical protein
MEKKFPLESWILKVLVTLYDATKESAVSNLKVIFKSEKSKMILIKF